MPPATPVNVAPANGAVNLQLTPALQSSAYSGSSPQGAAQWQIAEDAGMAVPLWDNTSTSALTQVTVASNVLQYSGRYYWHVRHIGMDGGKSAYSTPTRFDTEVKAGTFVKRAQQAAMILPAYPSSNFNGSVDTLFLPMPRTNGIGGTIMLWFDLSVFAGLVTDSNALLSIRNGWVDPNFGAIEFVAYELLKPWNESDVTWSSYVGGSDYTNNFGAGYGAQTLPIQMLATSTWEISQAQIQKWLDSPGTNFGIALFPPGQANAFIYTRKTPAMAPTLQISVVPEPAALALFALAGAALMRKRRAGQHCN